MRSGLSERALVCISGHLVVVRANEKGFHERDFSPSGLVFWSAGGIFLARNECLVLDMADFAMTACFHCIFQPMIMNYIYSRR